MDKSFESEYLCSFVPSETEAKARTLAQQYHSETEAYDVSVCTGPMGRDGILPANSVQRGMIERNARAVFSRLKKEAESFGVDAKTFQHAVFDAAASMSAGRVVYEY